MSSFVLTPPGDVRRVALAAEYKIIQEGRRPSTYKNKVHNWFAILNLWKDDMIRDQFLASLSEAQANSARLLHEWWYHTPPEPDFSQVRQWIKQEYVLSNDEVVDPPQSDSFYNHTLYFLWCEEFIYLDWKVYNLDNGSPVPEPPSSLAYRRSEAAVIAAAHRAAMSFYWPFTGASSNTTYRSPGASSSGSPNLQVPSIPACIEPCSWLSRKEKEQELPFYLWDVQRRCTISIGEYPQRPEYTVISHTWGRWETGESVFVPGVPWRVPRNSLYDVEELPSILAKVPFTKRYLWLDLVCIPQDDSIRKGLEIAKQASIFSLATYGIIWLNTIDGLGKIEDLIRWLSLVYVRKEKPGGIEVSQLPDPMTTATSDHLELVLPSTRQRRRLSESFRSILNLKEPPFTMPHLVGWFTSLWTLQEVCLRPNMIVCNRTWDVLSGGGSFALTLDHLIALYKHASYDQPVHEARPPPLRDLDYTLKSTGLGEVLSMTPIDVILLGNQRHCKEGRADAIMSVLGVTGWASMQCSTKMGLLDNKYPLAFIQAIQARYGAILFSATDMRYYPESLWHFDHHGRLCQPLHLMTMLPISTLADVSMFGSIQHHHVKDHESVGSWTIQGDGSVRLLQVGIISSHMPSTSESSESHTVLPEANIMATVFREPVSNIRCDLDSWIRSFRPRSERHAVCLLTQVGICHGIVIERIYSDAIGDKFIKIGTFSFVCHGIPNIATTKVVDWIIK